MASANWTAGTGDWDVATNWDSGAVPDATTDASISTAGSYTVFIDAGSVANTLTFSADGAVLLEAPGGSLTTNTFTMSAGTAILESANQIGALDLDGGVLEVTTAAALGGGTLNLDGGVLAALQSMTVTDALTFTPSPATNTVTIDAASDKTLDIGSGGWTINEGVAGSSGPATEDIIFNASTGVFGAGGTVLWHGATGVFAAGQSAVSLDLSVDVDGGTLKGADSKFASILANDTKIHSGGTIDLNNFAASIEHLVVDAGGAVTNTGSATSHLTIGGGEIDGTISGNLAVDVTGTVTYTGDETYTGNTKIDSGALLDITANGAALAGAILNNGTLMVAPTGAQTFAQGIIGAGSVEVEGGAGSTITLSGDNTYRGGTEISGGTLIATGDASLGTGNLGIENGGELLAARSLQLDAVTDGTTTLGDATIAAGHGAVLSFKAHALDLTGGDTLTFGDANGNDGIVKFGVAAGHLAVGSGADVAIAAGTLEATADGGLSVLLSQAGRTTVDSGATLDIHGLATGIHELTGAGLLTNSGPATTLDLDGAAYYGAISGALSLTAEGSVKLNGDATFTGTATIEQGALLHLGGTFGEDVAFGGKATLEIGTSKAFSGDILDFAKGDVIDLTNLKAAGATLSWDDTAHALTASSHGRVDVLTFDGDYSADNFVLKHDSAGNAEVVFTHAPSALVPLDHTGDLWG
ncbi:MAG TPA: autotransporter-associated beta strand repeat-containing protein [Rhizomicrobium sp.]